MDKWEDAKCAIMVADRREKMDSTKITWTHTEKMVCRNCGWVPHSIGTMLGLKFAQCRSCGQKRTVNGAKRRG